MADALPFAGPPCLMRPESAVTCSDASVSGGADAVSVEESPRANLKKGLAKGRPASAPIIAISLLNEIEVLSRRLMSPMVLFEAVWLQSPAKVVEGFGGSLACFLGFGLGLGPLTALKALGKGPGRPSWRLLERPTCSARRKARSTARANGSRFGVLL